MNNIKTQNMIEKLIDQNCPNIKPIKKTMLMSLFNRILTHDFPEDINTLEASLMKISQTSPNQSSRGLELFNQLKRKSTLNQKEKVIKCLIRISQDKNDNLNLSSFTMRQSFYTHQTEASMGNNSFGNINMQTLNYNKKEPSANEDNLIYKGVFRDIISAYQGIESTHFTFDKKLQMFILKKSSEKLFTVSMNRIILKLNEIGYLFRMINETIREVSERPCNLTFQSLIGAIK